MRPEIVFPEEKCASPAQNKKRKVSCKSIDSLIPPHLRKFMEQIQEEKEAGVDLQKFGQVRNSESILSRVNGDAPAEADLEDFEYDLESRGVPLDLESKLMSSVGNFTPNSNAEMSKLNRSKKIRKTQNNHKKQRNGRFVPKKNEEHEKTKTKTRAKLKMRKRSDEEYGKVVRGLTECVAFLKEQKGNFKFVLNNPFNKMKKELVRAEGELTSGGAEGASRSASFAVGQL